MARVITVQERGVVAIPADLRRRYGLEAGDQLRLVEHDDGRLELIPLASVPAAQVWFWSERWQAMEREVDRHAAEGEVATFEDEESFLEHVDRLTAE